MIDSWGFGSLNFEVCMANLNLPSGPTAATPNLRLQCACWATSREMRAFALREREFSSRNSDQAKRGEGGDPVPAGRASVGVTRVPLVRHYLDCTCRTARFGVDGRECTWQLIGPSTALASAHCFSPGGSPIGPFRWGTSPDGQDNLCNPIPVGHPQAYQNYSAYLAEAIRNKLPRARIVVTENGTTPGRTHVLRKFKAAQLRLGLPGWSFHSLRHAFISELVRAGASIEAVRILAGHSKLDVTARYAHATGADLSRAIEALHG